MSLKVQKKPKIGQRYKHKNKGFTIQLVEEAHKGFLEAHWLALADETTPIKVDGWVLRDYYTLVITKTAKDKLKTLLKQS